jgi:Flp pilus assembly protein TadD
MRAISQILCLPAAVLLLSASDPDYDRAVTLFQAGRSAEAAELLRTVVEREPKNAQAWKVLGVAYASQGDYRMAELPFANACQLQPSLVDACYYYGRNLYALNKFEDSLEPLRKALRADVRPARVHLAMAQSLEALGRAQESEEQFRRAISMNARVAAQARQRPDEDPRIFYGLFLFRQGRLQEALPPLQAAAKDHPGAHRAHFNLGRTLEKLERFEDAAMHLAKAVQLDPRSAPAHLAYGRVLMRLGRTEEAQRMLERGRELEPESATDY